VAVFGIAGKVVSINNKDRGKGQQCNYLLKNQQYLLRKIREESRC